ncbi:uncharacterized protein BP5553_09619 [Venustampulla echinocandica]|uniref:BTB domain-containing protein n=1 Tax=Venustampulla echinocandica TaxID=2656787 RepID=A0A370TBI8_9HELO|nr:uncharacterized protein BP5553_09619 [Venustampulla echinocandica]RDL31410.1 hypothetical protein BP5553_09619 [Venustampulla echinocandica]
MSTKIAAPTGLAQLLSSKKYSDLKLVCQGQEFNVHKAIVCSQSPVLAAAVDGDFQEARTNTIDIKEFDAWTVERMVAFMYMKDYDLDAEERQLESVFEPDNTTVGAIDQDDKDDSSLPPSTPLDSHLTAPPGVILLGHVQVNAIADYYNVPLLKELANTKIQRILDEDWSPNGFLDAVKGVLHSTSDIELHKIMASTATQHVDELIELDDFGKALDMSDFAFGIMRNTITAFQAKVESTTTELQDMSDYAMTLLTHESMQRREANRANRTIENFAACRTILGNTKACRNVHCSAEFNCYIESGGSPREPKYTLRCSWCYCRHRG